MIYFFQPWSGIMQTIMRFKKKQGSHCYDLFANTVNRKCIMAPDPFLTPLIVKIVFPHNKPTTTSPVTPPPPLFKASPLPSPWSAPICSPHLSNLSIGLRDKRQSHSGRHRLCLLAAHRHRLTVWRGGGGGGHLYLLSNRSDSGIWKCQVHRRNLKS